MFLQREREREILTAFVLLSVSLGNTPTRLQKKFNRSFTNAAFPTVTVDVGWLGLSSSNNEDLNSLNRSCQQMFFHILVMYPNFQVV